MATKSYYMDLDGVIICIYHLLICSRNRPALVTDQLLRLNILGGRLREVRLYVTQTNREKELFFQSQYAYYNKFGDYRRIWSVIIKDTSCQQSYLRKWKKNMKNET